MTLVEYANLILGFLTVLGQIIIILSVVYFFFFKNKLQPVKDFISKNGVLFAFIVALTATLGSLFYSEIAGYQPCVLCWYQRIFMYPEVILLGTALWKKDKSIINYSITLSIIGALIAFYHYLIQIGVVEGVACGVAGYTVSCAKIFVLVFGYIGLPLMALTAFLLIITSLLFAKFTRSNNFAEQN